MDKAVVEYLSKRLGKVILNTNKRQALGPLFLAHILMTRKEEDRNEDLRKLVSIATNIILNKTAETASGKKGEAALTHTAISIGLEISNYTQTTLSKIQMLHIGDLFIEAFYHIGLVDITIQEGFAPRSGAPYVVQINPKFSDLVRIQPAKGLLLYTSKEPIPDIRSVMQGNNFPVIKGINNETSKQPLIWHQNVFKKSIRENAVWVQSANKLQQQAWAVNTDVLDVIEANLDKILPEKKNRLNKYNKSEVNSTYKALARNPSEENKQAYNAAAKLWNEELVVLRDISKRAELETIYKKATALREWDEFYQYIDLDYRGRVYYREPFFNFQGADMARALFLFKDGVKLTDKGKRWLYIHAANCYNMSYDIDSIPYWCSYDYKTHLLNEGLDSISVDKMTLEDREMWTKTNIKFIINHTDKILKCEKPFSFLACCIEIKNVLENPDHLSRLPVPIDGSCNGYQHSSAIAKDSLAGELVSLTPTSIQADLYLKAAKALIDKMPDWFANRPDLQMKHIRKYITKRGTMTRAYSAGADKMADSMYSDCYTGGIADKHRITMVDCSQLSDNLIEALEEVCPGTNIVMNFLQSIVDFAIGKTKAYDLDGTLWTHRKKKRVHSRKQDLKKKKNKTVEEELELAMIDERLDHVKNTRFLAYGNGDSYLSWVSPSGFPVFYHSYLTKEMNVYVTLQNVPVGHKKNGEFTGRVTHVLQEPSSYASLQGLMSGISPNYIHSQDAAHMAMVVSQWEHSFGAVHDSYSTHAEHIDELAHLTRKVFIDIYDKENYFEEILTNILGDTAKDYPKPLPVQGDLDITQVQQSKYFFC